GAWRGRCWPSPVVAVSCLMVVAGGAVLAEVDWHNLRLGRGEVETLIGSTIFTGQILWLQRAEFARNNVSHFTLVMFAVIALVCLPVAMATGGKPDHWAAAYQSTSALVWTGFLTSFCTMGGYLLMYRW